jgi:hypothetical protein
MVIIGRSIIDNLKNLNIDIFMIYIFTVNFGNDLITTTIIIYKKYQFKLNIKKTKFTAAARLNNENLKLNFTT